MAALIIAIFMAAAVGILLGAFLTVSLAISRDDQQRGSLRSDAPNRSAQIARILVGITSSRWD
jgi:Na+(H+)/acetate symporter ActP